MIDLAIVNGRVWTGVPGAPEAQALAVAGDRLVAVGTDAEVRRLAGPCTRLLDAGGRRVVPGFHDAHTHFVSGGFALSGSELRQARSEAEFAAAVARAAARLEPGAWLCRGQWDHEGWPEGRRPSRWTLDPVTPRNPVFLRRIDGHIAVANSLALRQAGVSRDTPDPPGGTVERDERGEPTGILVDEAMDLIASRVPEPSPAERTEAARQASRHAASLGVTSVLSLGDIESLDALRDLDRRGELLTRVAVGLPASCRHRIRDLGLPGRPGAGLLSLGPLKLFADGSLGARSALFFDPYEDDPSTSGLAMCTEEELCRRVAEVDAAGLQAAVHAIGDRAVSWTLNAFERAANGRPRRDARHRLEHAQAVRPADRARFAALGVTASLQPCHCIDDMRWVERRLGSRAQFAYPYRSLRDAGARVALGTDWPVEPLDPMLNLYAAVTREFPQGGPPGGWYPAERVRLEDALADYTAGSACAGLAEDRLGVLAPGMLADLVILERDILAVSPREILGCRPAATIVGGRVVFED